MIPKRSKLITVGLAVAALAVIAYAFGFPGGYGRAVTSATRAVPVIEQFDRLFPGSDHSIGYYTGTHGPPTWNSKAALHGRYILTLQMPIRFNRFGRDRIVSHDEPRFLLVEVRDVSRGQSGTGAITYEPIGQLTFGPREWQRVVDANGDLGVLGIKLKTDAKVPLFDEYWRAG